MEVPIAVAISAAIINIPEKINFLGIIESPRLTVASTPPIPLAAPANAPAKRNIIHIRITPESPPCLEIISILKSTLSFPMIIAATNPPKRAASLGT